MDKIRHSEYAWCFEVAVDPKEYPDYYEKIKNPIDLEDIFKKHKKGDFYRNKNMMKMDLIRMIDNCKIYNDKNSEYYEMAEKMMGLVKEIFEDPQQNVAQTQN